tara:strand:+ start:578 stop:916 length:339 start_codon:yes stop_codon:yes gene_type:complete
MTTKFITKLEKPDVCDYNVSALGINAEFEGLTIAWGIEISIDRCGMELIPFVDAVDVGYFNDEHGRSTEIENWKVESVKFEMDTYSRVDSDFNFEIRAVEIDFEAHTLKIEL